MTKEELIKWAWEALAEVEKLPAKEQFRRLVEFGTIDENGEVIMGREGAAKLREEEEAARRNAPAVKHCPHCGHALPPDEGQAAPHNGEQPKP